LIRNAATPVSTDATQLDRSKAMMGLDNPTHIAFLFVLLLLVFGAKRLPELGRSLGAGLRGFKESISGESPVVHAEPVRIAGAADAASGPDAVVERASAQPLA
jgi:sec-independent protein translocase protein TatA